tara:strand:+ start:37228 stop:37596 length:369 start_codon:yes stop_codon:yes gene_type:complete
MILDDLKQLKINLELLFTRLFKFGVTIEIDEENIEEDTHISIDDDFIRVYFQPDDDRVLICTVKHYPGSFNPVNGGSPPEDDEQELGWFKRNDAVNKIMEIVLLRNLGFSQEEEELKRMGIL